MWSTDWFLQEYLRRFSFLTAELGFGEPFSEAGGLYASITYPRTTFATHFSLTDARDEYVSCCLCLWENNTLRYECRKSVEEILALIGVIPAGLRDRIAQGERERDSVGDVQIVRYWVEFHHLWDSIWKPLQIHSEPTEPLKRSLSEERSLVHQLRVLQADYYEYIWREYGAKIVQWAEAFFAEGEEAFYRNLSPLDLVGYIRKARPQDKVSCRTFEQMVERHFGFLRQYGFQRFPTLEEPNDERLCTVVFAGKHIGFMIIVDQPIVPEKDGTFQLNVLVNVVRLGDYDQRSLVSYLERQAGVEAFCSELRVAESASPVEREVARWAALLKRYGQRLLADREDSWEVG